MKRFFASAFAAAIPFVLLSTAALAQQAQPINYRVTTYYKIPAEKEAALAQQAGTIGRRIIEETMNSSGSALTSWTLAHAVYSGVDPSFNYATVATYAGAPTQLDAAARDQLYRKVTGMNYQDFHDGKMLLKPSVGSTLTRIEAIVPGTQMKEGDFVRVVRWKILPLQGTAYADYMKSRILPLQTQAVKEGRLAGWLAVRVVSPAGNDAPFDATTSLVYHSLAEALAAAPSDQAEKQFAEVFPGLNYAAYVDQGRAVRRNVLSSLARIIIKVDRPTTVSASR